MNKDKMKAIAAELAKDIKTPDELSQLSAILTKLTVEAALKSEINYHLGYDKSQPIGREGGNSPERGYALADFQPNNISALNFVSQQARCILPATLSFSGCALIKFNNFRLMVDKFTAPSSA